MNMGGRLVVMAFWDIFECKHGGLALRYVIFFNILGKELQDDLRYQKPVSRKLRSMDLAEYLQLTNFI